MVKDNANNVQCGACHVTAHGVPGKRHRRCQGHPVTEQPGIKRITPKHNKNPKAKRGFWVLNSSAKPEA